MKILLLHTKYTSRGGEDVVFEQEYELLKTKFNVEAITFQNKKGFKGLLQFFLSLYNLHSYFLVNKKIKTFNPDIIHIHNMHFAASPAVIRCAARHKKKIIVTLHNFRVICPTATLFYNNAIFEHSLHQQFPWRAIQKKVFRNSALLTFWLAFTNWFHFKIKTWNKVHLYIVLTNFARQKYLQSHFSVNNKNILVKPNFTFLNNHSSAINRNNKFLYIGRLSVEKGIIFLVKTCVENNIELDIIGEGELENEINALLHNSNTVKLLGPKKKDEVALYMKQYSALLFPSICYEGMPMVILEAFAASMPVIASHLGALPTIIEEGKNGFTFTTLNKHELLSKIKYWQSLTEENKMQIRASAFKTYLEKYSPENNLVMLENIYTSTLNNN